MSSVRPTGRIRRGMLKAARKTVFKPEDVKAVRASLGPSQSEFALMIGVSVAMLQNWEQGRRSPDGPALALLSCCCPESEGCCRSSARQEARRRIRGHIKRQRLFPADIAALAAVPPQAWPKGPSVRRGNRPGSRFRLCSRVGSLSRSPDHKCGQGDEAVACVKQWRFTPGTKDGVAVPVLVLVEITVTVRNRRDDAAATRSRGWAVRSTQRL
jgi:putative transcriptional regulator